MKSNSNQHKDPRLADLLQSVPPTQAPAGLADQLMLSVEAVAQRRKRVRKNLGIAMTGVGTTLVLMLTWLFTGKVWVEELLPQDFIAPTYLSSALMLLVTGFGMIALFVELEFVVKYWWQWRRLGQKNLNSL